MDLDIDKSFIYDLEKLVKAVREYTFMYFVSVVLHTCELPIASYRMVRASLSAGEIAALDEL